MNEVGKEIFDGGTKKGAELNDDVFKTVYNFYKFLTPKMSEAKRLGEFADWQGLDSRTVKKAEETKRARLRATLKLSNNSEYLRKSLDFFEPQSLWKSLEESCKICEWRETEECKGKAPANGCIYYCKNCKHKGSCERERGTDSKVPEECKILAYIFDRVDNAVALPYCYFPLKYILPLRDSKVKEDNEVLETLDSLIKSLGDFLGDSFNFQYISCVIRHAYMYNLIDYLPPDQKGVESTENLITCLFAYSRRSLSISRAYNEETLKDVLKQIVTDPIDDEQVKLWNKCNDFEKDLLKSQEKPKLGTVNDLLKCSQKDISIADIMIFLNHFADILAFPLRPIDIQILKKCMCWKDYSFERFLEKLPPRPDCFARLFPHN